ncbi:MAG: hypothetical protein U9P81_00315, partial [Euryarchaeota archaeon]|nr:hypothetical protein [Euryarchaeota archaeon]
VSILVLMEVALRHYTIHPDFGKIMLIITSFTYIKILLYIYQTLYKYKKKSTFLNILPCNIYYKIKRSYTNISIAAIYTFSLIS